MQAEGKVVVAEESHKVKEVEDTGSHEVEMVGMEESVTEEGTKGKIVGFK